MSKFVNKKIELFKEEDLIKNLKDAIDKQNDEYKNNKEEIDKEIFLNLKNIFKQIVKSQETISIESVAFLDITFSRILISKKEYSYVTNLFGANWYCDPLINLGLTHFKFIYKYFDELFTVLMQERKKYVSISLIEAEQEVYKYLYIFNNMLVKILRGLYYKILDDEDFNKIKKYKVFRLIVSELYENEKRIFVINSQRKTIALIKKEMAESTYSCCCDCQDYQNTVLNNFICNEVRLLYTDFRGLSANNLKITNSNLRGIRFKNSVFDDCVFINCFLNEANFIETRLNNVKFINCQFEYVSLYDKGIQFDYFNEANFDGSIFKNVVFESCCLGGINFSLTIFENVEFINSKLEGCLFTEKQIATDGLATLINSKNDAMYNNKNNLI